MPIMPLVKGARSFLLNGLMESDLDANNFKIWNLDTSNLGNTGAPNPHPKVAHFFLDSYDPVSRNFGADQLLTTDLLDFPSQPGHANQFLMTDGTTPGVLSWQTPQGGGGGGGGPGGFTGFLNVKQAPYNAKGDGVTDDFLAISQAISDACAVPGGGLTVYFPTGIYLVSHNIVPPGNVSLLGDNAFSSVIRSSPMLAGTMLTLPGASIIRQLGFDGRAFTATTGPVPLKHAILVNNANSVIIDNCVVTNFTGNAITLEFSYSSAVRNCLISNCGQYGIIAYFSPRGIIESNIVQSCNEDGILAVNSQGTTISDNQVYQCAPFGFGIALGDSDNSTINGNLVQQCLAGIGLNTSSTRALSQSDVLYSYGLTCVGNNVVRNYFGGIQLVYCHGFQLTGNTITDNGQGGADNATFTAEPGLMARSTNPGSGYQAGDIVTVVGGTGTPARAIVIRVGTGGVVPEEALMIISYGNYSVFPTNPVSFSGGSGTGLQAFFTTSSINVSGTGYQIGQVLRATTGTFTQPVRVMVTGVNQTGGITGFIITNGGGYSVTAPILDFVGDAFSSIQGPVNGFPGVGSGPGTDNPDLPDSGSGFRLAVCWGKRYSEIFNGATPYNLNSYHLVAGGIIGNNILDHCTTGCGYLNLGSSGTDRGSYLTVTGNSVRGNQFPFKGQTAGQPLDDNYNINSTFASNQIT